MGEAILVAHPFLQEAIQVLGDAPHEEVEPELALVVEVQMMLFDPMLPLETEVAIPMEALLQRCQLRKEAFFLAFLGTQESSHAPRLARLLSLDQDTSA